MPGPELGIVPEANAGVGRDHGIRYNTKLIMLGIEDKWVALAYLLCIGSMLLCVVYGWLNWNRGEEEIQQEDIRWAAAEDKVEDKL